MHPSYNHVTIGPGGVKCPCCVKGGCKTMKEVKKYVNRTTRRSLKNKLKKEEE